MSVTLDHPYTTVNDVKFYCGIDVGKTEWDDDIKLAINKASRFIDSATQRFFYKKSYSSEYISIAKRFSGWTIIGDKIFTPNDVPIITLTTIIENDSTLTENTDFYVDYDKGIIQRANANWTTLNREIIITADIGYNSADTETPSTDIPGDIAQYAMEISSRFSGRYRKHVRNYVNGSSEEVDLFGVPKEIDKALREYRLIRLL